MTVNKADPKVSFGLSGRLFYERLPLRRFDFKSPSSPEANSGYSGKHNKKICILIAIGIAILSLDQFLKWLALDFFRGGLFNWKIFRFYSGEVLSFGLYKNEGIAFGLKIPQTLFYVLVAVILFFILEKFKKDIKQGNWQVLLSLTLIGSGALSNLLDRFFRDYVVDYIHFFSWSAVNLADGAIIAGIIMLAWMELKTTRTK